MASRGRSAALAAVAALALLAAAGVADAAPSPFGIATPDSPGGAAWAGPLAPLFAEVAAIQANVYRSLTAALGSLRESPAGLWLLLGISFLYGVFHAAGPGHGKAVVTAYLLASDDTLKRGIVISFAASLVQGAVAIVFVGLAVLAFNATAMAMTDATRFLEIASYAAIALVGAWLLYSRIVGRGHVHVGPAPASLGSAAVARPALPLACDDGGGSAAHDHGRSSHAADPTLLRRPLTAASAWAAIAAVGVRPCSGAIIVLVFALSQGLYAAGIAATLLMAVGTGLTVAVLASLAVLAKDLALRLVARQSGVATVLYRGLEIAAAGSVLLFGLLLLGGALSGGGLG